VGIKIIECFLTSRERERERERERKKQKKGREIKKWKKVTQRKSDRRAGHGTALHR